VSYCRFSGHSDVFVYEGGGTDGRSVWVCSGCLLSEPQNREQHFANQRLMLRHLKGHVAAGHQVPGRALASLRYEIAWQRDWRRWWRSAWPRYRNRDPSQ
jgi:hypothetical protein